MKVVRIILTLVTIVCAILTVTYIFNDSKIGVLLPQVTFEFLLASVILGILSIIFFVTGSNNFFVRIAMLFTSGLGVIFNGNTILALYEKYQTLEIELWSYPLIANTVLLCGVNAGILFVCVRTIKRPKWLKERKF